MIRQSMIALAHPIYDPTTYDVRPLAWRPDNKTNAVLSVNIGQE